DNSDTASYVHAPTGLVASLIDPSKNTGDAKGDQYISIENLYGSQFDDTLEGDNGKNRINGSDGKDTLIGNGGDDTLDGGKDQNTLYGGEGNDTLYSYYGKSTLVGGPGDDIYWSVSTSGDTVTELTGEG